MIVDCCIQASKTIHAEKVAQVRIDASWFLVVCQELQEAADKINPALSAAKKSEACKVSGLSMLTLDSFDGRM